MRQQRRIYQLERLLATRRDLRVMPLHAWTTDRELAELLDGTLSYDEALRRCVERRDRSEAP